MRAGGYTVHQALTAEAAAVLKLALALASRRGHAQVTPLHVAFTLLGSSSSTPPPPLFGSALGAPPPPASSCAHGGLLRRACARAHPAHRGSPERCLELCFNVALNRLPTASNAVVGAPSSSSLLQLQLHSPTLSNALVAALKRAQANQRRGCVELQTQQQQPPSPPPPTPHQDQQHQQAVLTIKVELDQLVVSILDDPSVSRVMREAGFSSAAVKASIEEEAATALARGIQVSSPAPAPAAAAPPHRFFLEPHALWPPRLLGSRQPDACGEEDVRAILEVMSRKQQQQQGRPRRSNPVVVGDSASVAEASAAELVRRLELGDVPGPLRGARVLRLHLSHAHVRLMSRADVDAWAADLRRAIGSANAAAAGLVIYVGDMRWAAEADADADGRRYDYRPAEHVASELARLLADLRGSRCWLVAAASYGTYMRWQRSPLEAAWALQPVAVPAGGGLALELGPRAATASTADDGKAGGRIPEVFPPLLLDLVAPKEEEHGGGGAAALCAECGRSYESEAAAARARAEGASLALACFPGWPQADEPQASHEGDLVDLRRKWSRLCHRVHAHAHQPPPPCHEAAQRSNNPAAAGLCLGFDDEAPASRGGGASKTGRRPQDVDTTLSLLPPEASDGEASGDLKRKAGSGGGGGGRLPKRWRGGGGGGLDLNVRAGGEEEHGGGEDEPAVPSDLTNDDDDGGAASGDVADSLGSHCYC